MNVKFNFSQLLFLVGFLSIALFSSCGDADPLTTSENRDKFVASYDTQEDCGFTDTYVLVISAGTADDAVVITNFYGVGATVNATVDGSELTISEESSYSGSGTLSGNVLDLEFTTIGGTECTAVCTKQ